MQKLLYTLVLITTTYFLSAQGSALIMGNEAYHTMDRLSIKSGIDAPFHTSLKNYNRKDITNYATALDSLNIELTELDKEDLQFIFRDNNEWLKTSEFATTVAGKRESVENRIYVDSTQTFYTLGATQMEQSAKSDNYFLSNRPILKYFYKTPANFLEIDKKYFHLRVNPIIDFKLGKDTEDEELIFNNTRGVELRGGIDDRIFFYTNIVETQARFPEYVRKFVDKNEVVPNAGLFKKYESSIFNITDGYDYLNAKGFLGFNITKHVGVQFGHGKNFIGNGMRSLLLSDFATNYFYLKLNTKVWKFNYQNIFAELVPGSKSKIVDELLPKKYTATHHLSYNVTPDINVGIFESIVFSRNNQFELQYLNPIILYRSIEQQIGSPDNALLGIDVKWNFLNQFSLYGQLVLDEFKFDELVTNNNGWWANKYGIQAGLKYIDAFGVDHLDLQFEANIVRPYTYTHRDSSASYTHFNQALAHPLGANFKEYMGNIRYVPVKNLIINARVAYFEQGEDDLGSNWGSDILLSHNTRELEYGNEIGQGISSTTLVGRLNVSYQVFHNMFVDLDYLYRNQENDLNETRKTNYIGGGIRINLARQRMEF